MKIRDFNYGNYSYRYELIPQDRKTLSLTVRPDMGIVVKCPEYAQEDRINDFLKRKWTWLNKQLQFFANFQRVLYKREYVAGESLRYLGRQYKLIVKKGRHDQVSLLKGQLIVSTKKSVTDGAYNKSLIEGWYQEKAKAVFKEIYIDALQRFDYNDQPELLLRQMKKRWGSFTGNKRIILNPQLISASKECIDYVITHELCHMKYKNHDKVFFRYLKSKMPDWQKRKDRLESYLI